MKTEQTICPGNARGGATMRIGGVDMTAVVGCVPAKAVDSVAELAPLVGLDRARQIARSTGFTARRVAPAGADVLDLMLPAARTALDGVAAKDVGAVVAVSFSGRERFPALSSRLQHSLGLGTDVAAFDVSMSNSGWTYGLLAAAQLVSLTGRRALLVDGDVQSSWLDGADADTVAVMGDGATATLLSPGTASWEFGFLTDGSAAGALVCRDRISMDGFGVFRFVAGQVRGFLESFIAKSDALAQGRPLFVPHQANMYMVRQLADALRLKDRLVCGSPAFANAGSCSASLALAALPRDELSALLGDAPCPALFAGFGAGMSAGAVATTIGRDIRIGVAEI